MNLNRLSFFFILLGVFSFPLLGNGHGYQLGSIKIVHPWAMPTAATSHEGASGMGFLVLRNTGRKADTLLSVSTAAAKKVELHHYLKAHRPLMQQTETLAIPAGAEVRLEPGGSHLMLMGLEKPLIEGDHFSLVLQFEHAGQVAVDMVVQMQAKEAIY